MVMRKQLALVAALAALAASPASATHVPPGSELIYYDAPLQPGIAVTGTIGWSTPLDGYDWYCLEVVQDQPVSLAISLVSGTIIPNLGFLQGQGNDGDPASSLTTVQFTGNSTLLATTLDVIPAFTGLATVWVSTWLREPGGDYSLVMTGGRRGANCGVILAARFGALEAEIAGADLVVSWTTLSEQDTVGFVLWRGSSRDPASARPAAAPVEAHGAHTPYQVVLPAGSGGDWLFVEELTSSGGGDRSAPIPVREAARWTSDDAREAQRRRGAAGARR